MQPIRLRSSLEPMIRIVDNEGLIVDCNPKYARMMGYSNSDVIGINIFDHTPKDDHERLEKIVKLWKDRKPVDNLKVSLLTKHGNVFDVIITVQDILNTHGELVRTKNVLLDYGEVEDFQELVKESKYKSLYEESQDMYITVNIDGVIVDCNKTYYTKLGYTRDEIVGHSLTENTAHDSISDILINMAKWRLTGEGKPVGITLKKKSGDKIKCKISSTNLYGEGDSIIGRNMIIQDRTIMDEEIQARLNQQKEEERQKRQLILDITNELAAPITQIRKLLKSLFNNEAGPLTDAQRDITDAVLTKTMLLMRLTKVVLHTELVEYNHMEILPAKFDVDDLLADVKDETQLPMKRKNQKMVLINNVKTKIASDYEKIKEVLISLVFNSIDFSPVNSEITIIVSMGKKRVKFMVKDNGIGIPKDKHANLFRRVRHATHTDVKRDYGGAGVGLSVCHDLVKILGGKISFESEVGAGSTFMFTVRNADMPK